MKTIAPHYAPDPPTLSWRLALSSGLRRHAVALIGLAVALFGTSYNTWRNQTTEAHSNTRAAAFMVLDALGQLQEIADRRYYGGDRSDANRIGGWGKVSVVRDLAPLVSLRSGASGDALFSARNERVDSLDGEDASAENAIAESIAELRKQILVELQALN